MKKKALKAINKALHADLHRNDEWVAELENIIQARDETIARDGETIKEQFTIINGLKKDIEGMERNVKDANKELADRIMANILFHPHVSIIEKVRIWKAVTPIYQPSKSKSGLDWLIKNSFQIMKACDFLDWAKNPELAKIRQQETPKRGRGRPRKSTRWL